MRAGSHFRRIVIAGLVAATASIGLTAVTASGAVAKPKIENRTIIFAEAPGANPNYIFPYENCNFFSVDNINQFQDLMFRPLYWFGLGASAAEIPSLSIGGTPKYSDGNKVVKITLSSKYKFASGQTVNAESAKFFLDMYKADPTGAASAGNDNGGGYCGYNGGYGIPDQLTNVTASGQVLTLTYNTAINPYWDLYNNLSQITPMAETWDVTHGGATAGSGGCAAGAYNAHATNVACVNVENYLDTESGDTSTYAGSFWQSGDDGPWKLASFDSLGNATFHPNPTYGGPVKPKVETFQEKSYASYDAEVNDLSSNSIQLGFLDPTSIPACSGTKPCPNPSTFSHNYNLATGNEWGFNYAVLNFGHSDPHWAALDQQYIRVALQEGINQPGLIHSIDKGYGTVTDSPLPTPLPSALGKAPKDPYPSTATSWEAGKASILAHGWTEESGVDTCTKPGNASNECGPGVTSGEKLSFNLLELEATQCPSCSDTYATEIANWNSEGISVAVTQGTFNNIIADCGTGGNFEICTWGGGWIYAPDFEPTGESLFASTGGFNVGQYDSKTMDSLIHATDYGTAKLTAYGLYSAQQLPVLYEPTGQGTGEVSKSLKGVTPPNPLGDLMPEYLSY